MATTGGAVLPGESTVKYEVDVQSRDMVRGCCR